jgi:hypothetical protein
VVPREPGQTTAATEDGEGVPIDPAARLDEDFAAVKDAG